MPVSKPSGPEWWVSGKKGHLAPWAQAVVWALVKVDAMRELWLTDDEIAACVTKVGGGRHDHPSRTAISGWRHIFQQDPQWYPGKTDQEGAKPGPKKLLTGQKAVAIARCAMALKKSGDEPTVALVKEKCPDATWNPDTEAPFTDKYILEVFKDRCHDDGSIQPWRFVNPLQKTALPDWLKTLRRNWAQRLLAEGAHDWWFHRHCLWVDPCYNILTTSQRQKFDQAQAKKGKGKRWMSDDTRPYSRNLKASPFGGKQKQFGDRKLWWFVVMSRGRVHVEVMGHKWRQTGKGMAEFVERLPEVLQEMLHQPDTLPRVICSDRGPGFYQTSTGHITIQYAGAVGVGQVMVLYCTFRYRHDRQSLPRPQEAHSNSTGQSDASRSHSRRQPGP